MTTIIAGTAFERTIDYATLPKAKLLKLYHSAIAAHNNFFQLWQGAVRDHFDAGTADELTGTVYPSLESIDRDLTTLFYQELNFLWTMVIPHMAHMLTFARYDASLLPKVLDQSLDIESLSNESLVLLWNLSTLTYVMQTSRWVEAITEHSDQAIALKLEQDVWLKYGGAEDDLRYGLIAAGAETGNVETLLRGFQMAPGEVGLVDAEFKLEGPNHGWITHKRCPAHDRFRDCDKVRLESCCVLCVIAMRVSGEMVNEKIRCRPASLPPHKESTDHACRWEYWLEQ